MFFLSGILNGLREIWAHKFRSFLTMIGIILGVASLVSMVSVVEGLFHSLTIFFEQSGGIERLAVIDQEVRPEQLNMAALSPGRTLDDVAAIRNSVPLAAAIAPVVGVGHRSVRYGGKVTYKRIMGTTGDILQTNLLEIGAGRNIADLDVEHAAQVAVVGTEIIDDLFDEDEDPINAKITIAGRPFTIVGVLKHSEYMQGPRNALAWKNRNVFIPVTTAQKRFTGSKKINELYVRVVNAQALGDVVPQIENALRQTHRGVEDYMVETREDTLAEYNKLKNAFTFSLGSIAFISLLVGGIGIANVMLAVINERIREIGVRKAVGARGLDIFLQFLAEAFVVSAIGGIFGLVLSFFIVDILRVYTPSGENIVVPPMALAIGFFSSVIIGVLSGIYPSVRAARLDPIEALRYE